MSCSRFETIIRNNNGDILQLSGGVSQSCISPQYAGPSLHIRLLTLDGEFSTKSGVREGALGHVQHLDEPTFWPLAAAAHSFL